MGSVRPPAVAGTFYPDDPDVLSGVVASLLEGASAGASAPKAVIVPHAGYVYSGPVAAEAYAALAGLRGRVRRVVLLGPAHYVPVRGLVVPEASAFSTPLGEVPVAEAAAAAIADLPQVARSDLPHAPEHSLEVQLPFLQAVLGPGFEVLPLAVGEAETEEVAEVLERLWGGTETLVVVSSDLSHYLTYEAARALDARTSAAIEALAPEDVGDAQACGRVAVRGLLSVARRRGLRARTLDLRSSGDTAGPKGRVVGYGAWAFA